MNKKISFVDPQVTKIEKEHLNKAINSGWLSHGPYVEKLEKKFSIIMKANYSISVNNGTTAIFLILMSLNLKRGDEIIVPSFCYISPVHMIKLMGLVPVPVDIELDNFQINVDKISKKINRKTKAILLIHNYGSICDVKKIKKIIKKKNIFLIEDVSEVILSKNGSQYVGNCKNYNKEKYISYASFHASKTLIAGEGGMIVTNSKKIAQDLKILRNHGQKSSKAYYYEMTGGNFRLSNLLAAIAYSQLLRLKEIIKKKKKINLLYKRKLSKNRNLVLMKDPKNFFPIRWGFPLLLKNQKERDDIIKILNKDSILCRPGFYSLNMLKHLNIYNNKKTIKLDFRNAEIATNNLIVLPMHNNLKNNEVSFICSKINDYFKK
jgi:perosamine synthetase